MEDGDDLVNCCGCHSKVTESGRFCVLCPI